MGALVRAAAAWLVGGHHGRCAGCGLICCVRASLDRTALLCRRCDRQSFGSVPYSKGRVR